VTKAIECLLNEQPGTFVFRCTTSIWYSCSSTDTEPVIQLLLSALQCMFHNYSHIIQNSSLNIIFKKYFCTLYFTYPQKIWNGISRLRNQPCSIHSLIQNWPFKSCLVKLEQHKSVPSRYKTVLLYSQAVEEPNFVQMHIIALLFHYVSPGVRGSIVVKALCYKPEGRGFDSRWGEFLNLLNPSGRIRPWPRPLTEMSTRNIKNNNVSGE
jgi:hypothetical protein